MNCPKCVGKLQEKALNGVQVDVCYICEGIWFDSGELEQLLQLDSKDWQLNNLGVDDLDGKELSSEKISLDSEPGKCPRCEDGTMLERSRSEMTVKNVYVDVCPHKHGIWLDGGEIQLLRKRNLANLKFAFESFKIQTQANMEILFSRLLGGKKKDKEK